MSKLLKLHCNWKVHSIKALTKKLYTIYPSKKYYLCIMTLLNA